MEGIVGNRKVQFAGGSSVAGIFFMIYLLANSESTHSHDEIGHFLISRDAWLYPELIADTWGRTLHTLIYMVPVYLGGLTGARIVSLLMGIAAVVVTADIAKQLKLDYWHFIPALLFFQPWFAELAFLAITQVPFMLIMVLAVWMELKNKQYIAAVLVGLLPAVRHEGILLLGLWMVYQIYHKNGRAALLLLGPLLVLNITVFGFTGNWPFAIFLNITPNQIYGSGSWYHFLIRIPHPEAVGIPLSLLFIAGLKKTITSQKMLLIGLWYFSYFLLHSVLFYFGLFASGGYKFFLLPLAPAFAVLGIQGLKEITNLIQHEFSPSIQKGVIGCTLIIIISWTFVFARPHIPDREYKAMNKAAKWINDHQTENKLVLSTHVYFYYLLPLEIHPRHLWEKHPPLSSVPGGTIVIWDAHYSERWGLSKSYLNDEKRWRLITSFEEGFCRIYIKKEFGTQY